MAGRYDILCEQGATLVRTLSVKDDTGLPVVLTGYSARMQVRRTHEAKTAVVELSSANGRITIVANSGTVGLGLTDEITSTLPVGTFVYDLVLTDSSGAAMRLIEGKFIVAAGVTRSA